MNISTTEYNDTQHFFLLFLLLFSQFYKRKMTQKKREFQYFVVVVDDGKVLRKALYLGSLIDINYTIYKAEMNMN